MPYKNGAMFAKAVESQASEIRPKEQQKDMKWYDKITISSSFIAGANERWKIFIINGGRVQILY